MKFLRSFLAIVTVISSRYKPSLEPFLPRGDTQSLASGDTLALGLACSDSLEFQSGQAHLHHHDCNLATVWQAVRGTGTQTGTDTQ